MSNENQPTAYCCPPEKKDEKNSIAWIDEQKVLDELTQKIASNDPCVKEVKILQTFRQELSLEDLLNSIASSSVVESITFTGVPIDDAKAVKIANALKRPHCRIATLQLNNLRPEGVDTLCAGLKMNTSVRNIRLACKKNLTPVQVCLLLNTFKDMKSLETLKVTHLTFTNLCVSDLAQMIRSNTRIRNLCIKSSDFEGPLRSIADAILETNTVETLDLSENNFSDHEMLAMILQTPSIRDLVVSNNRFGKTSTEQQVASICTAVRQNTTLQSLDIGMNPMSLDFAQHLFEALDYNLTLQQSWMFMPHLPQKMVASMEHFAALNKAGRVILRQERSSSLIKLLPMLLARSSENTSVILSLLLEDPMLFLADHA